MLFSSLIFLFGFLPLVILCYYISPGKLKNYTLLAFSILFYAWGGVTYTVILLLSIILNYIFVKRIQTSETKSKTWLSIGLTVNVLVLVIFKYLGFFIENLNALFFLVADKENSIPNVRIVLPLGISFFTFHQMSLLWDVYRNKATPAVKFTDTSLYITFFPQLVAGPIVRYKDIIGQIRGRTETWEFFNAGIQRFILGLFKKVIIANTCASIADSVMAEQLNTISSSAAWLGIVAYTLQIYFDFSGYSDMAIGLAKLFGFTIMENFNFPYISKSIKEFWRRWHISLSTWFRDYVYIPLGGNQKSQRRTYLNLILVFFLTGFWHGATWSFIVWGLFHGIFLIIERLGLEKLLMKIPQVVSWAYTLLVVMIGWVFFRIEKLLDALEYILKLFGGGVTGSKSVLYFLDSEKLTILILAIVSSTILVVKIKEVLDNIALNRFAGFYGLVKNIVLVFMFVYSVVILNAGSYNPFIYFRF
ncbi:MAG: MBOAT family O-acyltransferase [Bacteroidia bacterium]|jgi:alginate O-acetyltransferase complex protein AlgI